MNTHELTKCQSEFEAWFSEDAHKGLFDLVKRFREDYSVEKMRSLELDEYVIGKGETFCYRIENELKEWGNIHGATSGKFGVYYGKLGKDEEKKYRIGKKIFGSEIEEAFKAVKDAIIELLENPDDLEILKKNPTSSMLRGKILSIYFPEEFLNIYSPGHLNHFITKLGLENIHQHELDKQKQLLEFKNDDAKMKHWSIFKFNRFLYEYIGYPPKEVKAEFVSLTTHPISDSDSENNRRSKSSKKIDYHSRLDKLKEIGDKGERIVVGKERQRLEKEGKPDLARKVYQISEDDDSVGYDIESYDSTGEKRYIEVKSTVQPIGCNSFFVSSNEYNVAKNKKNYYFYFVYGVNDKNPKIRPVKGTELLEDENIKREPSQYKVTIKIDGS